MKRYIKSVIVLCLFALLTISLGLGRGTSDAYDVFRTVSATEDTQLTSSTQKTAPSASNDGTIAAQKNIGALHVIFMGTAAADKTLSWTLWAYKNASSAAEYVAHGTATTGATETGNTNEYYCDTITISDRQWLKTVCVVNGAPDTIVSGGGIAKLIFDSCEYRYFKLVIRDIAGGGAEAATAGAKIANFY